VPFGEYIPFQDWLGRILSAVARGIAQVGVESGGEPRAMAIPLPDGREIRFGTPVCYELLFPDLVRRFAGDGGRALLAITNDAWYGRTGAPYQFLAITELRAAETGLWVARAANTGVSAFIEAPARADANHPSRPGVADPPLHPEPATPPSTCAPRRRVRVRPLDRVVHNFALAERVRARIERGKPPAMTEANSSAPTDHELAERFAGLRERWDELRGRL
jgi:hypothetical protein